MNTGIEWKKKFFDGFTHMMMQQMEGGARRYALQDNKEFTDLVCEVAGIDWIGGNITKYVGEIVNAKKMGEKPQRVNFVKIAVYAYLYYLKHLDTGFVDADMGEVVSDNNKTEGEVK